MEQPTVAYKFLILAVFSLLALGCGAHEVANSTADQATDATLGSADRAKAVAGVADSKITAENKLLEDSSK